MWYRSAATHFVGYAKDHIESDFCGPFGDVACATGVVLHRSDGTFRAVAPAELSVGIPLAANEAVMIEER